MKGRKERAALHRKKRDRHLLIFAPLVVPDLKKDLIAEEKNFNNIIKTVKKKFCFYSKDKQKIGLKNDFAIL